MEISTLRSFYRKFGGIKAIRFYLKMGLLWPMLKKVLSNPFSRHSYMDGYMIAVKSVETLLREQYSLLMKEQKTYYARQVFNTNGIRLSGFVGCRELIMRPKR